MKKRRPERATPEDRPAEAPAQRTDAPREEATPPTEIGGPGGPEPTRYGDWERNGRCYDF